MGYAIKTGVNEKGQTLYFRKIGYGHLQNFDTESLQPQLVETRSEAEELLKECSLLNVLFEIAETESIICEIVEIDD